jgi:hypothetical protein
MRRESLSMLPNDLGPVDKKNAMSEREMRRERRKQKN